MIISLAKLRYKIQSLILTRFKILKLLENYLVNSLFFGRKSLDLHLRHFFALMGFKAPHLRHTVFINK